MGRIFLNYLLFNSTACLLGGAVESKSKIKIKSDDNGNHKCLTKRELVPSYLRRARRDRQVPAF